MKLTSRIIIQAPCEAVWDHLVMPSRYRSWNAQIAQFVPISPGKMSAGFTWRMRYRYSAGESNVLAEVLECETPSRLVIHLTGGNLTRNGYALEIYELAGEKAMTRLIHTLEIRSPGLGTIARAGMRLRHLFGRSDGKRGLRRLKQLVEEPVQQ